MSKTTRTELQELWSTSLAPNTSAELLNATTSYESDKEDAKSKFCSPVGSGYNSKEAECPHNVFVLGIDGKPLTPTTSSKARKLMKGKHKGRNNPMYGKVTQAKRGYYNNICFRSSWEIAYAKYLDKNKIKWLYEPKTFDLGEMTYTPDFYLFEIDTYIEIKAFFNKVALVLFRIVGPGSSYYS